MRITWMALLRLSGRNMLFVVDNNALRWLMGSSSTYPPCHCLPPLLHIPPLSLHYTCTFCTLPIFSCHLPASAYPPILPRQPTAPCAHLHFLLHYPFYLLCAIASLIKAQRLPTCLNGFGHRTLMLLSSAPHSAALKDGFAVCASPALSNIKRALERETRSKAKQNGVLLRTGRQQRAANNMALWFCCGIE